MSRSIQKGLSWALILCMMLTLFSFTSVPASAADTLTTVTVELIPMDGKVVLQHSASAINAQYYKTTSADDSANTPVYGETDLTGWTLFSSDVDIAGPNGVDIFVQVAEVDANMEIVGWGQASAMPHATTGGVDSGLTGVTSMTLYNLKELISSTPPTPGAEYAIQRMAPGDSPLPTGYQQQSRSLVTIMLGKIVPSHTGLPPGSRSAYITPVANDIYYAIGGSSVSGADIYTQPNAFYTLFDSCGGAFAFNPAGSRYGCVNGGVTNAAVNIYTYDVYEMVGIKVEINTESRFNVGDTVGSTSIDKITGSFANVNDPNDLITAELAMNMANSIVFLHSDGTTSGSYAGSDDMIRVVVRDQNLGTNFTADVPITYAGGNTPTNTDRKTTGVGTLTEPAAPVAKPSNPVITVDGKVQPIGTTEVDENAGVIKTVVDPAALGALLQTAKKDVTISIPANNTAVAELAVKSIEEMADHGLNLTVQNGSTSLTIPAGAMDTKAIMDALGASNSADVTIDVKISSVVGDDSQEKLEKAVNRMGGEIVIPALTVSATASYGGNSQEIRLFGSYAHSAIELTAEQAARITTAITIESDGTSRHLPTYVYQEGGKWFAQVSNLTNSTFALIYNSEGFADAKGKWYEAAVNEMASRAIINGVSDDVFAGGKNITRAEFAAIIVRALGLPTVGDGSVFNDVSSSSWYQGAVGTAHEYNIVSGVGNDNFNPNAAITRQEAMVMLKNASKIAAYSGNTGSFAEFSDAGNVSGWASDAAEFCVGSGLFVGSGQMLRPIDNITRGEGATIILRLLQKSELVDIRTK